MSFIDPTGGGFLEAGSRGMQAVTRMVWFTFSWNRLVVVRVCARAWCPARERSWPMYEPKLCCNVWHSLHWLSYFDEDQIHFSMYRDSEKHFWQHWLQIHSSSIFFFFFSLAATAAMEFTTYTIIRDPSDDCSPEINIRSVHHGRHVLPELTLNLYSRGTALTVTPTSKFKINQSFVGSATSTTQSLDSLLWPHEWLHQTQIPSNDWERSTDCIVSFEIPLQTTKTNYLRVWLFTNNHRSDILLNEWSVHHLHNRWTHIRLLYSEDRNCKSCTRATCDTRVPLSPYSLYTSKYSRVVPLIFQIQDQPLKITRSFQFNH